jgi:altronate hydrolase
MASEKVLRIDPRDNVLVALTPLPAGEPLTFGGEQFVPLSEIPAKQKFAIRDLAVGDEVVMYGGIVGLIRQAIPRGGLLSTRNVQHDASGFGPKVGNYSWSAPDVSAWSSRTFDGYHRADGQVGTRNYWLVIPLVFCENRNVEALRDAFEEELGYGRPKLYRQQVRQLIAQHHQGARATERDDLTSSRPERIFPNVDGVRFLVHEGGCGGTRQDSKALCGLLAGYIHHPNVAGATVMRLASGTRLCASRY